MESLEVSARTVEEATQTALEKLGVNLDEVVVTVVKEDKSGAPAAEDAVVRVTVLVPDELKVQL
jgi:predicted RNA-binding protein Jag